MLSDSIALFKATILVSRTLVKQDWSTVIKPVSVDDSNPSYIAPECSMHVSHILFFQD